LARHGRDHSVDAAAVPEPGVSHRAAEVDPSADRADDEVDDAEQVVVILELPIGEQDLPVALNVDLLRTVDHDLGQTVVENEVADGAEGVVVLGQLVVGPLTRYSHGLLSFA
jgi:hypothetical protein